VGEFFDNAVCTTTGRPTNILGIELDTSLTVVASTDNEKNKTSFVRYTHAIWFEATVVGFVLITSHASLSFKKKEKWLNLFWVHFAFFSFLFSTGF
jgi:hypothetical protein